MTERKKLEKYIDSLRHDLNKAIEAAGYDLTNEVVLEKSKELDKYIVEYKKKYMNRKSNIILSLINRMK